MPLIPLQWGGGQEQAIRPGTIPVPLVVGLAKAAELALEDLNPIQIKLNSLRNQLLNDLREQIPDLIINGSIENIHNVIGKSDIKKYDVNNTIGASSISDISGIPRATCVRKLEKLVKLGMLEKDKYSKRYYVNQNTAERTEHILKKDNVLQTITIFSDFLSTMLSSLIKKK